MITLKNIMRQLQLWSLILRFCFGFLFCFCFCSPELKWAFLIIFCRVSVCLSVFPLSVWLSVCNLFYIFDFFYGTTLPMLTKRGTNHDWLTEIQVFVLFCFLGFLGVFFIMKDHTDRSLKHSFPKHKMLNK